MAMSYAVFHRPTSWARRSRRVWVALNPGGWATPPASIATMSGEATSSICFSGYPSQYFARRTAAAVRSPYTPSMGPGSNVPNELCSSTRCAWATSPPSIGGELRCSGTAVVVVAMSRRNTSPATGLSSVEPRILGHPGHEPVLAALALEHLAPQRVGVGAEHVTRQRGL